MAGILLHEHKNEMGQVFDGGFTVDWSQDVQLRNMSAYSQWTETQKGTKTNTGMLSSKFKYSLSTIYKHAWQLLDSSSACPS